MKNLVLLLFSFVCVSSLHTQTPWALFPEKQITYWQVGDEIKLFYNDSTIIGNVTDLHYFGAVYYFEDANAPCFDSIILFQLGWPTPPVDSIFSTPEYWFAVTPAGDIPFYHLAEPGDEWSVSTLGAGGSFDEIVFTCNQKTEELVLNEMDSVKTYAIETRLNGAAVQTELAEVTFKLSKNAGFLSFTPLRSLTETTPEIFNLTGYDDGQPHGFTSRFGDYFEGFEAGQIFKWEEKFSGGGNVAPPWYKGEIIYRDSVLNVEYNTEGVELTVSRQGVSKFWEPSPNLPILPDTTFSYQNTLTVKYHRNEFEPWIKSPPSWFSNSAFEDVEDGYTILSDIDIDSTGLFNLYFWESDVFLDDGQHCFSFPTDGCSRLNEISTGIGLTRYLFGCLQSSHLKQLIGYTLDGTPYGDLDPVSSTSSRPLPNIELQISPNPATTSVWVAVPGLPINRMLEYTVSDVTGRILTTQTASETKVELDLRTFPAGLYLVSVKGEGVFGNGKFLKF